MNRTLLFCTIWVGELRGKDREPQFLFQRILIAVKRLNAVLLHDGFVIRLRELVSTPDFNFLPYFFSFLWVYMQ